jgi:hypothetical protein
MQKAVKADDAVNMSFGQRQFGGEQFNGSFRNVRVLVLNFVKVLKQIVRAVICLGRKAINQFINAHAQVPA